MNNIIYGSGIILLKNIDDVLHVGIVYRSYYDDYTIPKGTLEKDEYIFNTACREIKEETNISSSINNYIGYTEYTSKVKNISKHRIIFYYLSYFFKENNFKASTEIDKFDWLDIKYYDKLSYKEDRSILNYISSYNRSSYKTLFIISINNTIDIKRLIYFFNQLIDKVENLHYLYLYKDIPIYYEILDLITGTYNFNINIDNYHYDYDRIINSINKFKNSVIILNSKISIKFLNDLENKYKRVQKHVDINNSYRRNTISTITIYENKYLNSFSEEI